LPSSARPTALDNEYSTSGMLTNCDGLCMQVVAVHVHEAVLVKDGAGEGKPTVDVARLRPLGRLGGNTYCRVGSVFDLPRPDRSAPKSGAR